MAAALSFPVAQEPQSLAAPEVVIERNPTRHRPGIVTTWASSYQPLMPQYAKSYGMTRWDWVTHCADVLWNRGAIVLAAYVEGYPDAMLGWICGSPGTLHYAYTFKEPRRRGVASHLLANLLPLIGPVRRITHRPGKGRGNLREKAHALGWKYEPLTPEELGE